MAKEASIASDTRLDILARILPQQTVVYRRDCVDLLNERRTRVIAVLRPGKDIVSVAVTERERHFEPVVDESIIMPFNGPSVSLWITDKPNVSPPKPSIEVVDVEEGRKRIRDLVAGA